MIQAAARSPAGTEDARARRDEGRIALPLGMAMPRDRFHEARDAVPELVAGLVHHDPGVR